ncbi:MAG: RNase P subunit p30 family protein [Candidatus Aenigmarchaeota archaeon]|nr:RNase P subunit p30 family protein [Candidatus Aenigmarchaeota archaeon]
MRFYDLEIHSNLAGGENTVAEIAKFAEHLGYAGIAICDNYESLEKIRHLKEQITKIESTVEIYLGVKIYAETPEELKKIIDKIREEVEIIVVAGGKYDINRAACENPKVDILAHPELDRYDNGLDEICLNEAKRNNVAIQLNLSELLYKYRRQRATAMGNMMKNVRLCRDLKVPVIACSGANGIWDMRDPRKLVAMANVLGTELESAFSCASSIPQSIVENNKKKLKGEKVTEGVEIG